MLRKLNSKTRTVLLGTALSSALMLAACDDSGERTERARTIIDATMDQLAGREAPKSDAQITMESVDVADRAIAGTIRNDLNIQTASARSQFAIGSIIAKPKDIPDVAALEDVDDPELVDAIASDPDAEGIVEDALEVESGAAGTEDSVGVVRAARAMPRIKLDPKAPEESRREIQKAQEELQRQAKAEPVRRVRSRSLTVPDAVVLEPAPTAPGTGAQPAPPEAVVLEEPSSVAPPPVPQERMAVKKMARRSLITPKAIQAQTDAQSVMLDTMSKYGVGGEVALSRGGQMVIQIGSDGADPTQFSPEEAGAPRKPVLSFLAQETDMGCPDTGDLVTVQSNPVLATECIVEDLRKSGQFEYVEKDYIFENQFAKRPRDPKPEPTNGSDGGDTGNTGGEPPDSGPPALATITPNDPLWSLQWHFKDNGDGENQSPGGAGFQDFWSRQGTTGSEQVVVAVVDTGLQMSHPDIEKSPNVAPGWDMVSDPRMGNDGDGRDNDPNDPGDLCDPTVPFAEDSFHGTHVAGTVGAAATNNGSGVAGGAWDVKIVPVRALGKCGGRLSDINDAIRWAGGLIPGEDADGNEIWNDNPADIINLSIGLFEFCPASLQDAIDSVVERGVVVVSAAGNARVSTKFYAPGGCQNVLSVAAGDARGQIAPYSNFGEEVDILAPGGDLMRDDNGDGRPDGVLSTKSGSNCYDPITGEGVDSCFYAYEQGTSMAAPHVSAALALLKSRNPDATSEELTSMLLAALDPRDALQCAGECSLYPGAAPIPGSDGMCARPCGAGLLNLANIPEQEPGGGGTQ